MTIPSLRLADFKSIRMDFDDTKKCWDVVPARPGWYAIETNAPLEALADFPLPEEEGEHYRIAKRLEDVALLISQGVAIVPAKAGAPYVAYSGEHGDLKSRARQHICGHKGTGCLSLRQYEIAHQYSWTFYYRLCEEHLPGSGGNKMLRNYLEQKWRGENGWPVLCSR